MRTFLEMGGVEGRNSWTYGTELLLKLSPEADPVDQMNL
jgi:hypothetical protein